MSFDYEAFRYCVLQVAVRGRTEEEESRSVYSNADMFYGRENYQNVYINLTNPISQCNLLLTCPSVSKFTSSISIFCQAYKRLLVLLWEPLSLPLVSLPLCFLNKMQHNWMAARGHKWTAGTHLKSYYGCSDISLFDTKTCNCVTEGYADSQKLRGKFLCCVVL